MDSTTTGSGDLPLCEFQVQLIRSPSQGHVEGRQDSLVVVGNFSEGRNLGSLVLRGRWFCNRLVTCSSKKGLLIIFKNVSCLRKEQANKLNNRSCDRHRDRPKNWFVLGTTWHAFVKRPCELEKVTSSSSCEEIHRTAYKSPLLCQVFVLKALQNKYLKS
jgi:hypothetical protein